MSKITIFEIVGWSLWAAFITAFLAAMWSQL